MIVDVSGLLSVWKHSTHWGLARTSKIPGLVLSLYMTAL